MDTLTKAIIGFDKMFDDIEQRFTSNYPPYNIIKVDADTYEIQVAVTGFDKSEIKAEVDNRTLTVSATHATGDTIPATPTFLHRGLSTRPFVKQFTLDQYIEVQNASVKNGLLLITLKRIVPDAMKSREINIAFE